MIKKLFAALITTGIIVVRVKAAVPKLASKGEPALKIADSLAPKVLGGVQTLCTPKADHLPIPSSSRRRCVADGGERGTGHEPYAEDTPLTWIFGGHPETKIVAALLREHDRKFTPAEIERLSGVDEEAVRDHFVSLDQYDVIDCDTTDGADYRCQVNLERDSVEGLHQVENDLLKAWHEKRAR
jgi:hypothetical protein